MKNLLIFFLSEAWLKAQEALKTLQQHKPQEINQQPQPASFSSWMGSMGPYGAYQQQQNQYGQYYNSNSMLPTYASFPGIVSTPNWAQTAGLGSSMNARRFGFNSQPQISNAIPSPSQQSQAQNSATSGFLPQSQQQQQQRPPRVSFVPRPRQAAPRPSALFAGAPRPRLPVALQQPEAQNPPDPSQWPPSLKRYVERAYERCENDFEKDQIETKMKKKLDPLLRMGMIYKIDWDSEPLPG